MPSERAARIREYLESAQDDTVHFLKRLVVAESPSADPASQAAVQRILAAELKRSRFRIRYLAGTTTGGLLLAVPRSRKKEAPVQLVIGHTDTVWPVGTLEAMPFELDDGQIRGPGVYDMKGGLTLLAFALRALRSLKLKPEVTPVILLNSDEELGELRIPASHRQAREDRGPGLRPGAVAGQGGSHQDGRKGVGEFAIEVKDGRRMRDWSRDAV